MRRTVVLIVALLLLAACSGSDGEEAEPTSTTASTGTAASPTTIAAQTGATTTTAVPIDPERYRATVEALAGDDMDGRDNQTPGSVTAQDYLVAQLETFAEPVDGDFRHPFATGTNLLGVLPGTDLAEEYVILGAHYDHLGRRCRTTDPADVVCNGATDNAAGVATVLEIGRLLAAGTPPRRSVVFALWDAEEDGLQGSASYVGEPAVPLADTVAYLNWDIQGLNLLPSLRDTTIVVGAETGGSALADASDAAIDASDLDALQLSLLFGQGRSDHAVFANSEVPTVFFTDANAGCYHTSQDDLTTIDLDKLGRQIPIGAALAIDLASTDDPPAFVADAPAATFNDAESMLAVLQRSEPDFGRFGADEQAAAQAYLADLQAMVDAGEAAFDEADVSGVLAGAAAVLQTLTASACDGYLE